MVNNSKVASLNVDVNASNTNVLKQNFSKEHLIAFEKAFKRQEFYFKRLKLIRYDKKNSKTLPFINSVGILFGFSLPEGLNRQIKDDELNQINNTVAKMFGNKGPRSIPINFDAGKNDFQSFGLIFKSKKEINDVLCNLYFNLGEKEISNHLILKLNIILKLKKQHFFGIFRHQA